MLGGAKAASGERQPILPTVIEAVAVEALCNSDLRFEIELENFFLVRIWCLDKHKIPYLILTHMLHGRCDLLLAA